MNELQFLREGNAPFIYTTEGYRIDKRATEDKPPVVKFYASYKGSHLGKADSGAVARRICTQHFAQRAPVMGVA